MLFDPGMSEGAAAETFAPSLVPNQLAVLVPTFDPSKDDLQEYTKKVKLLMKMWPDGKWTELATRLILGCSGTAFQKLQLSSEKVTSNSQASIQSIIEILGGQWGQIPLERKYETAEKALFRCVQRPDETNDSYLARTDVLWQEMLSREIKLEELQSYIVLRGSNLNAEDKKRVVLECEASSEAKLTMTRVSAAIRLLGAGFFQEVTTGKKTSKLKTYDGNATMFTDQVEGEETFMTADMSEEIPEEEVMDILVQGDEDAILISDFESAATDLVQSDEELAAAFTAYTDARRRLSDKMKSRGFWPIAQKGKSKGGGKFVKGKFSKGHGTSRKSLQQRIMESRCRLCNKVGHWKAECPLRNDAGNNAARSSQAPTSFVQVSAEANEPTALSMEFLQLPLMTETPIDVTQQYIASGFVQQASSAKGSIDPKAKLAQSLGRWNQSVAVEPLPSRIDDIAKIRASLRHRVCNSEPDPRQSVNVSSEAAVCFATHGSFGVLDLGATKTVIGSNQVSDFLSSLHPKVRKTVKRCACNITFRFGNQGTLKSEHAMIVPIEGMLLKIAIVPGSTPFLLSNTLLRALEAVIDTKAQVIVAGKSGRTVPLTLTSKGLFLVDLNDLIGQPGHHAPFSQDAETHSTVDVLSKKPAWQHQCTGPSQVSMQFCQENNFITTSNKSSQPVTPQSPKVQPSCNVFSQKIESSAPIQDDQPFRSKCNSHLIDREVIGHSHVAVEAPPADAGQESDDQVRLLQDVNGRHGSHEDRFRSSAAGKDLQDSVGPGTVMGDMVCSELRAQPQVRAPGLLALRGNESGACRAHPAGHSCDQPRSKDQDAGRFGHQEPGHAKELCSSQEQGCSSPVGDPGRLAGLRLRSRSRELRGDPRPGECGKSKPPRGGQSPCPCDGTAPLSDGERDGQSNSALGISGTDARGGRSVGECPSLAQMTHAGDLSGECFYSGDFTPEVHQERKRLWQLVHQFTSEFEQLIKDHASQTSRSPKLSILEVFCGPNSQLSHQARQLGYRAERCGRAQCDLQSVSGRQYVFQQVIERRPKSVWLKNNVVKVLEALIHNEVVAPPHCIPSSTESRYLSCLCLSAQHGFRHVEPATAD